MKRKSRSASQIFSVKFCTYLCAKGSSPPVRLRPLECQAEFPSPPCRRSRARRSNQGRLDRGGDDSGAPSASCIFSQQRGALLREDRRAENSHSSVSDAIAGFICMSRWTPSFATGSSCVPRPGLFDAGIPRQALEKYAGVVRLTVTLDPRQRDACAQKVAPRARAGVVLGGRR